MPTVVEDFDVEHSSSAVEAVLEVAAVRGRGYPAEGVAAWSHHHQPSSLVDHLGADPCGPEQRPPGRGPGEEFPAAHPSPLGPCVPEASVSPDLVDGEEATCLPVSAEPSSSEHPRPVGFSSQFLPLQVGAQEGAAVGTWELGPEADSEDVGLQYFQPSLGHQAAAGEG